MLYATVAREVFNNGDLPNRDLVRSENNNADDLTKPISQASLRHLLQILTHTHKISNGLFVTIPIQQPINKLLFGRLHSPHTLTSKYTHSSNPLYFISPHTEINNIRFLWKINSSYIFRFLKSLLIRFSIIITIIFIRFSFIFLWYE